MNGNYRNRFQNWVQSRRSIRARRLTTFNSNVNYARLTVSNVQYVQSINSLVFRAAILVLVFGFLSYLLGHGFNAQSLWTQLSTHNFAPFDFTTFVSNLKGIIDTSQLPEWIGNFVDGFKGLIMVFGSIAYAVTFVVNFLLFLIAL